MKEEKKFALKKQISKNKNVFWLSFKLWREETNFFEKNSFLLFFEKNFQKKHTLFLIVVKFCQRFGYLFKNKHVLKFLVFRISKGMDKEKNVFFEFSYFPISLQLFLDTALFCFQTKTNFYKNMFKTKFVVELAFLELHDSCCFKSLMAKAITEFFIFWEFFEGKKIFFRSFLSHFFSIKFENFSYKKRPRFENQTAFMFWVLSEKFEKINKITTF